MLRVQKMFVFWHVEKEISDMMDAWSLVFHGIQVSGFRLFKILFWLLWTFDYPASNGAPPPITQSYESRYVFSSQSWRENRRKKGIRDGQWMKQRALIRERRCEKTIRLLYYRLGFFLTKMVIPRGILNICKDPLAQWLVLFVHKINW